MKFFIISLVAMATIVSTRAQNVSPVMLKLEKESQII
jgi:hypothetical protein